MLNISPTGTPTYLHVFTYFRPSIGVDRSRSLSSFFFRNTNYIAVSLHNSAQAISIIVDMGSLFAKPTKKAPVITSKDKAILDLKITRDKLTKYQKQVENVFHT